MYERVYHLVEPRRSNGGSQIPNHNHDIRSNSNLDVDERESE